jgi:hypothetical protein
VTRWTSSTTGPNSSRGMACPMPGYSTNRAPGMRAAVSRPPCQRMSGVALAGDDQHRGGDALQARVVVSAPGGKLALGGGGVARVPLVTDPGGVAGPLLGQGISG